MILWQRPRLNPICQSNWKCGLVNQQRKTTRCFSNHIAVGAAPVNLEPSRSTREAVDRFSMVYKSRIRGQQYATPHTAPINPNHQTKHRSRRIRIGLDHSDIKASNKKHGGKENASLSPRTRKQIPRPLIRRYPYEISLDRHAGHHNWNIDEGRQTGLASLDSQLATDRPCVTQEIGNPDEAAISATQNDVSTTREKLWYGKMHNAKALAMRKVCPSVESRLNPMIRKYQFNDQKRMTQNASDKKAKYGFDSLLYTYKKRQLRKPRYQIRDNQTEWPSRRKHSHWQRCDTSGESAEAVTQGDMYLGTSGASKDVISDSIDDSSEGRHELEAENATL